MTTYNHSLLDVLIGLKMKWAVYLNHKIHWWADKMNAKWVIFAEVIQTVVLIGVLIFVVR